jgi:LPS export ABC transporter protein LptC
MKFRVISCKIISAAFFICFFNCNSGKDPVPVSSQSIETPFQEFANATLYFYNKEFMQWKLEAKQMKKPLADSGHILVVPVRLTLFDSLGNVRTFVLADSGSVSGSMDSYFVWGNVYIKNSEGMVVKTQKLKWSKQTHKVESDTYVQIETRKGDILRGKGLDATEDFSHFTFKSNVSGKFPDFKERLENKDEPVF